MILAKKALAGTSAEEDRAGSAVTRKRWLFAEMSADERNAAGCAFPAKTKRSLRPVHLTIARAKNAMLVCRKRIHESQKENRD